MVEMRMREHDLADGSGVDRKAFPVEFPKLTWTLEQTTIDKKAAPVMLDQMLGAGDGARAA